MIAPVRQRNPERSRERILAAAAEEFSERGFAGARVDAIARRAGLNKQLISHHFGGKQALYEAVLRARRTQAGGELAEAPGTLPAALAWFYEKVRRDPSWLRLLLWEALDAVDDVPGRVELDERRRRYADRVAWVEAEQEAGRLPADLAPDLLLLSLLGAATYPVLLPQVCRLITGDAPDSEEFARRYERHLTELAAAFAVPSER
jgi:TetR/AcrR family transcriptional regulator